MNDYIDDYDDEELDRIIETQNARKKPVELNIPDFLSKKDEAVYSQNEELKATLNNVPNNSDIENINHLKQLEEVALNYSIEEWNRVLLHAPSDMMSDELKRRLRTYEEYLLNTRNNLSVLTDQKL